MAQPANKLPSPLPAEYHEALRETGASLKHIDRLAAVGQWRLRKLRRSLRQAEKWLGEEITSLYARQNIILGKTPENLAALTEYAVDTEILNPGMYPETPTKVGISYFTFGHSTFVRCGNCKHGSWQEQKRRCTILSIVDPTQGAGYNSPCFLRQKSDDELRDLDRDIIATIERTKKAREVVRRHLLAIKPLVTEEVFPMMVNHDYGHGDRGFRYGDRVRVFVRATSCKKSARFTWQPGTIVASDHLKVVCLDHPVIMSRRRGDEALWPKHIVVLDRGQYDLLHEWEYQWLRKRHREKPNDPFLTEWRSCFNFEMGSNFDRLEPRGPYWTFPAVRIVDELFTGKEVEPVPVNRRLMSIGEALTLLQMLKSDLTDSLAADRVVARFHDAMALFPGHEVKLRRAKDTLMLHLLGAEVIDNW